ncbi:hypothetical protein D3C85_1331540 [compost metagenome]
MESMNSLSREPYCTPFLLLRNTPPFCVQGVSLWPMNPSVPKSPTMDVSPYSFGFMPNNLAIVDEPESIDAHSPLTPTARSTLSVQRDGPVIGLYLAIGAMVPLPASQPCL